MKSSCNLPSGKSVLSSISQPSGCAITNGTFTTVCSGQASIMSQPMQAPTSSVLPQVLSPSKKCVGRESCGSLSDVFGTAAKSSALLPSTINQHNSCLTEQLATKQLNVIRVEGEGNCLFRTLSVCLHGNQL